jgi:hypothetical protein
MIIRSSEAGTVAAAGTETGAHEIDGADNGVNATRVQVFGKIARETFTTGEGGAVGMEVHGFGPTVKRTSAPIEEDTTGTEIEPRSISEEEAAEVFGSTAGATPFTTDVEMEPPTGTRIATLSRTGRIEGSTTSGS